jgi:enoyl-CoA hydratase/carnithine racemase
MNANPVQIKYEGNVSVLKMARPPANAITLEMAEHFEAAYDEIAASDPQALVLTGEGRFFCGGLDLREVPTYEPEQQEAFLKVIDRLIGKLYASAFPVVAAANGHAVAAGYILLLTADYRIGPKGNHVFGLTEARVGIPFPAAPMTVLKAELGSPAVRYTTLSARNYGPEDALQRGVFDELQESSEVLDCAIATAEDLASMPGDTYSRIKYQVRGETIGALDKINRSQSDLMMKNWISPLAKEASEAVLKDA